MYNLTPEEIAIYNEGERLIPGRTHDFKEVRRHYGSYIFFKQVIESDMLKRPANGRPVTIADLGSGVGHGCFILAVIPGVEVLGVDMSSESLDYARKHFLRPNITYQQRDLATFIATMPSFDYVISRGVLEHILDGIGVAMRSRWSNRLLFDVPYDEPAGRNPYHLLSRIREDSFTAFPGAELLYEDVEGVIYYTHQKPASPNMILCACSKPGLQRISELGISLPFTVRWSDLGEEANPPLARVNEYENWAGKLSFLSLFARLVRRISRAIRH